MIRLIKSGEKKAEETAKKDVKKVSTLTQVGLTAQSWVDDFKKRKSPSASMLFKGRRATA